MPAHCISTCLSELIPGLDYKINLIALTEHMVGKQRQRDQNFQETASDSIYNSDDDISVESYDDGVIIKPNNKNSAFMKNQSKSADSGRLTFSPFSEAADCNDFMNFVSTVKTMRSSSNQLETYPSCKVGPTLVINYNNLVVPPDHASVVEVLGESAQLAWNFSVPKNIRNSNGMILVRPELFYVMYWKHGQSIETAKSKQTKGKQYHILL